MTLGRKVVLKERDCARVIVHKSENVQLMYWHLKGAQTNAWLKKVEKGVFSPELYLKKIKNIAALTHGWWRGAQAALFAACSCCRVDCYWYC